MLAGWWERRSRGGLTKANTKLDLERRAILRSPELITRLGQLAAGEAAVEVELEAAAEAKERATALAKLAAKLSWRLKRRSLKGITVMQMVSYTAMLQTQVSPWLSTTLPHLVHVAQSRSS
jgi:hypothetical protein